MKVKWKQRSGDELKKDMLAAIAANPATHEVKVLLEVNEVVCTPTGEVPSAGQKLLAERAVA